MQGTIIVVECSGQSLCGHDTIKAFNEIGVPMFTNVVANVPPMGFNRANTKLGIPLSQYADVFPQGHNFYKEPLVTVTFQLK